MGPRERTGGRAPPRRGDAHEQRHQGQPRSAGRPARRLARGAGVPHRGLHGPADLHHDRPDRAPAAHADVRSAVSPGDRLAERGLQPASPHQLLPRWGDGDARRTRAALHDARPEARARARARTRLSPQQHISREDSMTPLPDTGIHLLEPRDATAAVPAQWGVPWPRGALQDAPLLDLATDQGSTPVDTWVTARWPDGSVKWTGHAGLAPGGEVSVVSDRLTLDVGPGPTPIRRLLVEGREVGRDGGIVATSATSPHPQAPRREHRVLTTGVKVERAGAQQAVLRLAGHHEVD